MKRYLGLLLLFVSVSCVKAQINTDAMIKIGRDALYYEDYALSIQYFNQAISAKPYLYSPYYFRAIAKYYLGDYYGAINDCGLSVERDPYIAEVYRLRAINYVRTYNYEQAISDYKTLIDQHKAKERDLWYNLVLCCAKSQQFEEADRYLDSMIVKWPEYSRSYMLKAQIAQMNGDRQQADILLSQTLKVDSTDVDAWLAKAQNSLDMRRLSECEDACGRAINLQPYRVELYLCRATSRYLKGKIREALDDYNVVLQLKPDNYIAHFNRGLLYLIQNEYDSAASDFDYVLSVRPNDKMALINRARIYQSIGEYSDAIPLYTKVLDSSNDFAEAYSLRAYCYRKIGNTRLAINDEKASSSFNYSKKDAGNNYCIRYETDEDLKKYDCLVVENEDNMVMLYSPDYHGKTQNKDIAVDFQPLYAPTFYRVGNELSSSFALSTAHFLDDLNSDGNMIGRLTLSSREASITEQQYLEISMKRKALGEMLETNSHDTSILLIHALYLICERDYDSAIQELNQYLDVSDSSVVALYLRSVAFSKLAEVQSQKKEQTSTIVAETLNHFYNSIIRDLSEAISLESDCAYLYYNRAYAYSVCADYQKAIDDYTSSLALNSSLPEAYYNRGLCYINKGNLDESLQDLSKAGELGLYTAYSLINHFRQK